MAPNEESSEFCLGGVASETQQQDSNGNMNTGLQRDEAASGEARTSNGTYHFHRSPAWVSQDKGRTEPPPQ